MITFRRMIYILIAIIVLLSVAIVCISIDFKRTKHDHKKKVTELNYVIVGLAANSDNQLGQLRLSDEIKEKLVAARETIDKDMMDMQYDFVKTLSENKLLD